MNDDIYRQEYFIQPYSHSIKTTKLTDMTKQSPYSTTGSLQLTLHISDNHLTLKIIRVKGLSSQTSHIIVKISFIPDLKPLECYTRIVPYKNHTGIFNEKFTFEINDDDISKRLCLSIYESNQMKFQGCLSFGIRNTLRKQKIQGWFYLLPEDIGEYRHKQITNIDEKFVSKINRDIADLEEYQLIIPRGSNHSFGFTVVGDNPTFIGKVSEHSPAALCGLKSGDFIVKINGQNVSRAQQRTVSNLIKHLKHSVILDIHRYPNQREISSFDSSTCSDSSNSFRPYIDLGQIGNYVESKPVHKPIYEPTNTSLLAIKGSPTNTFI